MYPEVQVDAQLNIYLNLGYMIRFTQKKKTLLGREKSRGTSPNCLLNMYKKGLGSYKGTISDIVAITHIL
jgi:hypothetical protein